MHDHLKIDPVNGIVYGPKGSPVRKKNRQGYIHVRRNDKHYGMAHRIIWEFVHGPIPSGMQINHINGVKDDNRICNLELVTPSENMKHAYRCGLLRADGEHNGRFRHGRRIGRSRKEAAA